MDQQTPVSANGNGAKTVEEKIDRLAIAVKEGFDGVDAQFKSVDAQFKSVDAQFKSVDAQFKSVDTQLTAIRATMVTKSYLDEKLADLKGDLIAKLRKEDEKLNFIIALLRARSILSDTDLKQIHTEFQVFPSLTT